MKSNGPSLVLCGTELGTGKLLDLVLFSLTQKDLLFIQGLVLSAVCLCIFLDSLLQAVSELTGPNSYAFADDFKFVTGTSPREHRQAQSAVNLDNDWSKNYRMLLSLNKRGAVHCGNNNPIMQYFLYGHRLPVMSQFKALGVLSIEIQK